MAALHRFTRLEEVVVTKISMLDRALIGAEFRPAFRQLNTIGAAKIRPRGGINLRPEPESFIAKLQGAADAKIDHFRVPFNPSRVETMRGDYFLQADSRSLISVDEHPSTGLAGPWVELGTERESLLQVLDEYADFGGQPAAGGPQRKNWHCSFKGSEKTDDGAFSEFRGEEPCWRLGNPQMLKNTHPHLFNIAGSKDSCGNYTFRVLSRAKAPRLYGAPLDKNDRSKVIEVAKRFRCTVACKVLRSGDENGLRLREPSRNQSGVWKITRVDSQIEAVFDDRCRALGCRHFNCHIRVSSKKSRQL